jgi:GT2 family glycosyltransferase
MLDLTIIIVTYNSAKIITHTLSRLSSIDCKIIISDNNSIDNTIDIVKDKFPKVRIITNKHNIGFSKANNIAFKQANTGFVATLNPDCFFENVNDIDKIINIMHKNSNIAIASGELYGGKMDKDENIIIQNKDNIAVSNYIKQLDEFYYSNFISGCFMVMRVEIFQKIGFFNEKFFLYCEDNEICKRVLRNKYDLAVAKNIKIIHLSNQSSDESCGIKKFNYNILWYRFGWSKLIYTQEVHNKFIAKLRAVRNIIKNTIIILYFFYKKKQINPINKAILYSSFAYLVGKTSLDVNKYKK